MKNIVKTTVLTLLITAIVLSLSGCLFSLGTSVIFTVDGEIWERNFSSDPDNAKPVIAPEKDEHTLVGWNVVRILDDGTYVFEAVWQHDPTVYTVKTSVMRTETLYSVVWNTIVTPSHDTGDYYDFVRWLDAETLEPFDFTNPITGNVSVVAEVSFNSERSARIFGSELDEYLSEKFGENPLWLYTKEAVEICRGIVSEAKTALTEAEDFDSMSEILESTVSSLSLVRTYSETLTELFESYDLNEYYDEQAEELKTIYEKAYERLVNYRGGSPSPTYIVSRAAEALEGVNDKARDNEIAENLKSSYKIRLNAFAESLVSENTSPEISEKIGIALKNGLEAINSAIGTKALSEAYANAVESVKIAAE